MDAFKTSIQQAKDNVKELSRIGVNNARTFEQTSRDTTATPRIGSENIRVLPGFTLKENKKSEIKDEFKNIYELICCISFLYFYYAKK